MQFAPAVSELEIRSVQDGIANGVRSDGRALTQRRPFSVTSTRGNDAGYYGGSSVEVHCDGTTIVAAATPSVVELNTDPDSLHNLEKKGVPSLRGPLFVSIDAVPAVVDYYARALRNGTGRYRQAFLSRLALTIRHAFGAEGVTAQEQQLGVAEVELLADEATNSGCMATVGEARLGDASERDASPRARGSDSTGVGRRGFPGEQLYVGGGYAFRIDVDVHILQGNGGNLPAAVSIAVHAALKTIKLPSVTLHEASSGFSLEVDHSRPYSRPMDWSQLPVVAMMLVSPTRHYVVDPTRLEELALPQQLLVAVNAPGQVWHTQFQQLPSRRGNAWRLGKEGQRGHGEEKRESTPDPASMPPSAIGVSMPDLSAMLQAGVHICQAVIAECDELLLKGV